MDFYKRSILLETSSVLSCQVCPRDDFVSSSAVESHMFHFSIGCKNDLFLFQFIKCIEKNSNNYKKRN